MQVFLIKGLAWALTGKGWSVTRPLDMSVGQGCRSLWVWTRACRLSWSRLLVPHVLTGCGTEGQFSYRSSRPTGRGHRRGHGSGFPSVVSATERWRERLKTWAGHRFYLENPVHCCEEYIALLHPTLTTATTKLKQTQHNRLSLRHSRNAFSRVCGKTWARRSLPTPAPVLRRRQQVQGIQTTLV